MTKDQLKEARRKLGFTQEQLAEKLGIKLAKLRNWEQGRNAVSDEGATAVSWLVAGKLP